MHHIGVITEISAQAVPDPRFKNLISSELPTMAFQSETDTYLMDALLAMAALHLGNMSPEGHSITRVAPHYFALALAGYNKSLRQLNQANSGLVFISSAVIALYASLSRRELSAMRYTIPVAWFWTFRGVRAVASAAWLWITDSKLKFFTDDVAPPLEPQDEAGDVCTDLLHRLQLDKCSIQDAATYLDAIKILEWAHSSVRKNEKEFIIRRKLMKFPALVPFRFVDPLLSGGDPRALVITAYFFGMLKFADNIWWLQNVAEHEVTGLATIIPPEWAWGLEFPLRLINPVKVEAASPGSNSSQSLGPNLEDLMKTNPPKASGIVGKPSQSTEQYIEQTARRGQYIQPYPDSGWSG
jgi:Fungal specific transcription factor domain